MDFAQPFDGRAVDVAVVDGEFGNGVEWWAGISAEWVEIEVAD